MSNEPRIQPHLATFFERTAQTHGTRLAVVGADGRQLTYSELDDSATRLAAFLAQRGVRAGDRVALALAKGVDSTIAMLAILKSGAAYVPVSHAAPIARNRAIFADCAVRAAFLDPETWLAASSDGESWLPPTVIVCGETARPPLETEGALLRDALEHAPRSFDAGARKASDVSCILYTSGSTGMPKGVVLTHDNTTSFVEWAGRTFDVTASDRLSSHAPFYFDLSIFDLHVAWANGACVYLIGEDTAQSPVGLRRFISDHALTIWYSTPTILRLMLEFGKLASDPPSSIRLVLFAGEVFPIRWLRELVTHWQGPRYFNLYGPTETNVCTFASIPDQIPADRTEPYPIGHACDHCEPLVLDENGARVAAGEPGLLHIAGRAVFREYWNRPELNARAFVERDGKRFYNTGDVVVEDPKDGFLFLGRRDRMVKRRGYRIELGEIERAIYQHPSIREAAAVALTPERGELKIRVFVSFRSAPLSIVEMKQHAARTLLSYMIPDEFVVLDELPRTSTDKIDYQKLIQRA